MVEPVSFGGCAAARREPLPVAGDVIGKGTLMQIRTVVAVCARSAFTLIELLVVVAIVALLISILLPGLRSAKDEARRGVCLNNLREIGRYTGVYAQENRDRMPRSMHSAGYSYADGMPWAYEFYALLTGQPFRQADDAWWDALNTFYHCPFDPRRSPLRWYETDVAVFSYGFNVYFELTEAELGGPPGSQRCWRLSTQAPRPSRTVVFGELKSDGTSMADHAMAHFWSQFGAPPEIDVDRHDPHAAYAFLDGHAARMPFVRTFDRNSQLDLWNPATAR